MKLANQRKAFGVIVALGVAALVVDKLVLDGGATPALAADESVAAAGAAGPVASRSASARVLSVAAQVAAMEGLTGPDPEADAFAPPPALTATIDAEVARQQEEMDRAAAQAKALELVKTLNVTAVRLSGEPAAMINGKRYTLGDSISGTDFEVREIAKDGVILAPAAGGATVTLKLPTPEN